MICFLPNKHGFIGHTDNLIFSHFSLVKEITARQVDDIALVIPVAKEVAQGRKVHIPHTLLLDDRGAICVVRRAEVECNSAETFPCSPAVGVSSIPGALSGVTAARTPKSIALTEVTPADVVVLRWQTFASPAFARRHYGNIHRSPSRPLRDERLARSETRNIRRSGN